MFHMEYVSKNIREARVGKNLTQMDLADAMGVSYQAVSNWERGNSMPDISKLPDLCRILGLSFEALVREESETAETVGRMMEKEEVRLEELEEAAPALTPEELQQAALAELEKKGGAALGKLVGVAPYFKREDLAELVEKIQIKKKDVDMDDVVGLAPFLSGTEALDRLAWELREQGLAPSEVAELAPFLSRGMLRKIASRAGEQNNLEELENLAPFLSGAESMDELMEELWKRGRDLPELTELVPFISHEMLRQMAGRAVEQNDMQRLVLLAPYFKRNELAEVTKKIRVKIEDMDIDEVVELAPYLANTEVMDRVAWELREQGLELSGLSELAPFLSHEMLWKIARSAGEQNNLEELEELAPYLAAGQRQMN